MARTNQAEQSKFTPKVTGKILELVGKGHYLETACAVAGVVPLTVRNWLRRGERGEPGFAEFAQKFGEAELQVQDKYLDRIDDVGKDDWRSSAWVLEKRFPKTWGNKSVEVSGKDGGPIQIQALADLLKHGFDDESEEDSEGTAPEME